MGATGQTPLVGIVMGSRSDWETMQHAAARLEQLGVAHEVRVVSAHRTPDVLFEYAASAAAQCMVFGVEQDCVDVVIQRTLHVEVRSRGESFDDVTVLDSTAIVGRFVAV